METASDGWQALVAAIRTPPSLVLLDMRMPILDGWEFAREVEARGLDVPIVVMTAAEAASEVAEEIDADDWVGKPFNLEELLSAVRTALASRSSAWCDRAPSTQDLARAPARATAGTTTIMGIAAECIDPLRPNRVRIGRWQHRRARCYPPGNRPRQVESLGLLGFLEPKEGEMITVTERAAAGLEEMLRVNNAAPGQGVKLVPTGIGSIGMTIDTPGEGDEVISTGAEATLIVDSRVAEDLDGVIDCEVQVIEGEAQTTFKLRPAA